MVKRTDSDRRKPNQTAIDLKSETYSCYLLVIDSFTCMQLPFCRLGQTNSVCVLILCSRFQRTHCIEKYSKDNALNLPAFHCAILVKCGISYRGTSTNSKHFSLEALKNRMSWAYRHRCLEYKHDSIYHSAPLGHPSLNIFSLWLGKRHHPQLHGWHAGIGTAAT